MTCVKIVSRLKGSFCHLLLVIALWLCSYQNVVALPLLPKPGHISSTSELPSSPNSANFQPIEISPTMIPHYPFHGEPMPPMYPSFPKTYDPVLTGRCPVNFSVISSITAKTASDCTQSLSTVVGNVICCPQFNSLLHIFQGFYSNHSDTLVLQNAVADDCFKDIISILASRGANSSLSSMCSVKSSNLTGGSCPVKDISTFEKAVNTSKLLDSCSTVDPLKECCRPFCQPAISEAALQISGIKMTLSDNKNIVEAPSEIDTLNDCKGVVYSWIARKVRFEDANNAFRLLSSCKVNKACPLDFKQPSEVINACRNLAAPSPSCCSSLNAYITGIQKQMLITNRQAIICAAVFGYMLQKAGVMTNVYELCDVDLKDFSLQAYGQEGCPSSLNLASELSAIRCNFRSRNSSFKYWMQSLPVIFLIGCLLRSLPADLVYDNSTGFSFTCDLNDNIAAPWPSSSSVTSLSLCAPEMSLPALPTSQTLGSSGCHLDGVHVLLSTILIFVSTLLY